MDLPRALLPLPYPVPRAVCGSSPLPWGGIWGELPPVQAPGTLTGLQHRLQSCRARAGSCRGSPNPPQPFLGVSGPRSVPPSWSQPSGGPLATGTPPCFRQVRSAPREVSASLHAGAVCCNFWDALEVVQGI